MPLNLGHPIDISGTVTNKKGEVITSFNTLHQGMGKFLIVPQATETYTLNIEEPKLYKRSINFPEILKKGYALSYMGNIKNNCFFKISKNFEAEEELTAVWQIEGIVIATQTFSLNSEHTFKFNTQSLPTEIAKLTLFDKNSEPFAERLVFINGREKVTLDIELNHNQYLPRSKVTIDLKALVKDSIPVDADLSLTVTNISKGINPLLQLPDIRDYTLLKTELSGNVYEPAQYFNDSTAKNELAYHQDLLMLTHGWRKFDWYYQLNEKIQPNYSFFNYDTYRGQVTKGKNIFPNAQIDVFTFSKRIESFDFECNDQGRFSLNPEFEGKVAPTIMIYANKKNKLSKTILTMQDKELSIRDSILTLFGQELKPYIYQQNRTFYKDSNAADSLFKLWDTKYIDEVTVNAEKIPTTSEKELSRFQSDQVYKLTSDDLDANDSSMEEIIMLLNKGLYNEDDTLCKYSGGTKLAIPIVYNDILRTAEFSNIEHLSGNMLECVAFVKGAMATFMYGSTAQDGVLMVWAKAGGNIATNKTLNKNAYTSKRYNRVRTFYTPTYKTQLQKHMAIPDKRITMHWDNAIKTDSLGKASVSFYTSDLKGDYLINIQGITQKNGPVFKEQIISVE